MFKLKKLNQIMGDFREIKSEKDLRDKVKKDEQILEKDKKDLIRELWKDFNQRLKEGKQYIQEFVFFGSCGNYFVKHNNRFKIYNKSTITSLYFDRWPPMIKKWFCHNSEDMHTVVNKIGKEPFFIEDDEKKINIAQPFLHTPKPYKSFSEETRSHVDLFLSYIKEVLASDVEESYVYILKWLAYMAQGHKNDSILYMKSPEGTGKSTLCEFILKYVIGPGLSIECTSEPIVDKWNSAVVDKAFVFVEELSCKTPGEWRHASDTLKRWASSSYVTREQKGIDPISIENNMNIIVNSNHEAIYQSSGRRYFLCDISEKYMNDRVYYGHLKRKCYNLEVGHAFYNYLLEYDTKDYIPQDMPETKSKKSAQSLQICIEFQFLKDMFVMKKKGLDKLTLKELYEKFSTWHASVKHKLTQMSKNVFGEKIKKLIPQLRKNGKWVFHIEAHTLKSLAVEQNWLHELDEQHLEEEGVEEDDENVTPQPTINPMLGESPEILFED